MAIALLAGCGGRQHVETPAPTQPLPTAGLAAQQVSVLPLTLLAAEDSLHWQAKFADRRAALAQADSVIGTLLTARAPEVTWVLPEALRKAARRAPGIAPDPDQMGTAVLRASNIEIVPDPLRGELRTLVALGGNGGRYALVPASRVDALIAVVGACVGALYPTLDANSDYTSIVNERHYARLSALIDDARAKGARIVTLNPGSEVMSEHGRKLAPTLIISVSDDMAVIRMVPGQLRTWDFVDDAAAFGAAPSQQ